VRHVAEEPLHALVHEARLAGFRQAVQLEESGQRAVPPLGRGVGTHGGAWQLALELPDLAPELVTVLAGETLEVGIPGIGQLENGAALLALDERAHPGSAAEPGQDLERGRGRADRVEVPFRGLVRAVLEQGLPHICLASGGSDQIEIVGDVHSADEAPQPRALVAQRQHPRQCAGVVGHPEQVQRPRAEEGTRPGGLPLPREKDRRVSRLGKETIPAVLVQSLETRQHFNLHRCLRLR
jgi:hypothetical protein